MTATLTTASTIYPETVYPSAQAPLRPMAAMDPDHALEIVRHMTDSGSPWEIRHRICSMLARVGLERHQGLIFPYHKQAFDRLLHWATDLKMLSCVLSQMIAEAGQAPGTDGLSPADITEDMLRNLQADILAGTFQPSPLRQVCIAKPSGGMRELNIPCALERVLQKSLLSVLSPTVDPSLEPFVHGFRPGRSPHTALYQAIRCLQSGFTVWGLFDLRDAFGSIPHGRLIQILEHRFPNELLRLLGRIINRTDRGIPQGAALSPFMLNLYLDHFLDKPWGRMNTGCTLIRYADDLLICAPDLKSLNRAQDSLVEAITPHGLRLQDDKTTRVDVGETMATYMGFNVFTRKGRAKIAISEGMWQRLQQTFAAIAQEVEPEDHVRSILLGWINYLGPALSQLNRQGRKDVVDRIKETLTPIVPYALDKNELYSSMSRAAEGWLMLEVGI